MFSLFHYFLQALIILDLGLNQIGAEGAQYLANALEENKVIRSTSAPLFINELFYIDTHYTDS
jgi:Ran GTPase-activating protein (RanGAP) involved in mRNA processing and transport